MDCVVTLAMLMSTLCLLSAIILMSMGLDATRVHIGIHGHVTLEAMLMSLA